MADTETGAKPVQSFEKCLDELEKVGKELEAGDLSLERSLERVRGRVELGVRALTVRLIKGDQGRSTRSW